MCLRWNYKSNASVPALLLLLYMSALFENMQRVVFMIVGKSDVSTAHNVGSRTLINNEIRGEC